MIAGITFVPRPPFGTWFVLDVMKKGCNFRKGRPPNIWVALLIDMEPDRFCNCPHNETRGVRSAWLDLGRFRTRDAAYDCAEQMIATRH